MIRTSVGRYFTSNFLARVRLWTHLLLNGGERRHGAKGICGGPN